VTDLRVQAIQCQTTRAAGGTCGTGSTPSPTASATPGVTRPSLSPTSSR